MQSYENILAIIYNLPQLYSKTLPSCGFILMYLFSPQHSQSEHCSAFGLSKRFDLRLSEPREPQLPAAEARKYASLSASCVPHSAEFVGQVKRLRRERHDKQGQKQVIKIDLA